MATIADHIAARNDTDLLQRFVAAAERANIPNPQAWAEANRGRLVAADIGGSTVADVHAYAVATYDPPPRPGENPAAVTDPQIEAAVETVYDSETSEV